MKNSDLPLEFEQKKESELNDYSNGVHAEEVEEENPTAYALLTKIEDPYYTSKQSKDIMEPKNIEHEENKSNIQVYESFYSSIRPKSGSFRSVLNNCRF